MGITIFKIFIWGGISSDIRSEITFYGSAVYRRIYVRKSRFTAPRKPIYVRKSESDVHHNILKG